MRIALLFATLAAPVWAQEPSLDSRSALYEAYLQVPRLVRGGAVEAHWLEDGSSFWYRAGARAMFVDPAEGVPRDATREDRAREPEVSSAMRGGRLHAPASSGFAALENGALTIGGGDLPVPIQITEAEENVYWSLDAGAWSPNGRMLYSLRRDARGVFQLPVVDYGNALETVERSPYLKTGTAFPVNNLAILRVPDGERVDVDLGPDDELYIFPVGWREGGRELLFLRMNREASRLDLMAADASSGESRVILTDTRSTFVGGLDFITGGWREYFTPIEGGDRFLWISERDGWRHVYQYDYEGSLISRVTEGEYPVQRIIGVDAERDRVFVMANAESRVYDTHLYSAPLGGGELVRLTEGIGEHRVQLSPSKLFFVDTHSSLERPPVSELRDVEGNRICELDKADVSGLDELGWSPGEPFVVQAADGETNLHGILFKPRDFDPSERYPVIDFIYTGPFITMVPNTFAPRSPYAVRAQAMAQMGFITFIVDPRGTVERSKAFQDASYGRIGEIEIPDHVATLRQIAAERPYMDLDRVGIYGHSWGGYFALRAMLTAPDMFKVGVASAPGELTEAAPINEPYMRTPENNPEGYAAGLNAPLASQLRGKLLIIHGTADINAPFSTSMRMVDALIHADRPFDLLVLPGATHSYQGAQQRYATNRTITYFLEHLAD